MPQEQESALRMRLEGGNTPLVLLTVSYQPDVSTLVAFVEQNHNYRAVNSGIKFDFCWAQSGMANHILQRTECPVR